jgi:pilus assembly protein CpaB
VAAIAQTRPASGIRTPLFLVGIALALIAFVGMFTFGILFARGTSGGRQVSVVIAAQDIAPREPIDASMLTVSQFPATNLPPKAITSVADLSGFSAVVTIYKGQVITANVVASSPDQLIVGSESTSLPIPAGFLAITLPTNEMQGVGGYVAQGDYIDVWATLAIDIFYTAGVQGIPSNWIHRSVTRAVFSEVRVIRVGPQSTIVKQGQPQGVSTSLTVVMSPCDANFLTWFLTNSTLKYALVSYKDVTPAPAVGQDPGCSGITADTPIGPGAVDARYHYTKG